MRETATVQPRPVRQVVPAGEYVLYEIEGGVLTGWNPLISAASGAAFAGVLAALVIAVSIQIAFQSSRDQRDQSMSLRAAAPTLVTLMVASYLYIVLDGIPSSSTEVADALGPRMAEELRNPATATAALQEVSGAAIDYGNISARGFAMAGTVLALGALMTLFIVVSSVFDNTARLPNGPAIAPGELQAREWAQAVLRVSVVTLAPILILGYRVGVAATGGTVGWLWWLMHLLALAGPAIAVWSRTRLPRELKRQMRQVLRRLQGRQVPSIAVWLLTGLPCLAVLTVVTAGRPYADSVSLNGLSFASSIYYGISAAALLLLVERRV